MRVYIACLQPHGSLLAQKDPHTGMKRNGLVSTPESLALWVKQMLLTNLKESGFSKTHLRPRQAVASKVSDLLNSLFANCRLPLK